MPSEAFAILEPFQHPPKFNGSNPSLSFALMRPNRCFFRITPSVAWNQTQSHFRYISKEGPSCRRFAMDLLLAQLYERHAEDCARSAEKIDSPGHRVMLLKAAAEWRKAAQQLRQLHPSPAKERAANHRR